MKALYLPMAYKSVSLPFLLSAVFVWLLLSLPVTSCTKKNYYNIFCRFKRKKSELKWSCKWACICSTIHLSNICLLGTRAKILNKCFSHQH
ncbi:hypothetical protein P8452_48073 [Trifolium repens]|nr:hypothetical protein P8452_48073 [Trifolium repens]